MSKRAGRIVGGYGMSRRVLRRRFARLIVCCLGVIGSAAGMSHTASAATVQSTLRSAGYSWNSASNWTNSPTIGPNDYPSNGIAGNTYEVTVPYSVNVTSNYTIDRLTTVGSSSSIAGNGAATTSLTVLKSVFGPLRLGGVAMYVPVGATLSSGALSIERGKLQIGGTATIVNSIDAGDNGTIEVSSTGQLTFADANAMNADSPFLLQNAGIVDFQKSLITVRNASIKNLAGGTFKLGATATASTESSIASPFTNEGTFQLLNGIAVLSRQQTSGSTPIHHLGGTINVQAAGTLVTQVTEISGATFTGTGKLWFADATVFKTAVDVPATLSATFAHYSLSPVVLQADAPVRVRGSVELDDAVLKGAGGFTLDSVKLVNGLHPSVETSLMIPQGGKMSASSQSSVSLRGGSLSIAGQLDALGSSTDALSIDQVNGTESFTVKPTGVINTTQRLVFGPSLNSAIKAQFLNQGLINIYNSGSVNFTPSWAISGNEGSIQVTKGAFTSAQGLENVGTFGVGTGSVDITQPATATFGGELNLTTSGAIFRLTGGHFAASVSNVGQLALTGLTFDNPLNIGGSVNLGGATTLLQPLTVSGVVRTSSPTFNGPGALILATSDFQSAGVAIRNEFRLASPVILSNLLTASLSAGGSLAIEGTAQQLAVNTTDISAANAVNVKAGGKIEISGTKKAMFTRTGSTATATLSNAGRMEAKSGGVISIGSGWSLKNSGVVEVTGGSFGFAGSSFTNTGRMEIGSAGWLALNGTSTGSTLAQIRAQLAVGQAGGSGIGPLAGSPASASVGYGTAAQLLGISGTQTATWHSLAVDPNSILLQYTLSGDADLDGSVNLNDLIRLANNYGQTTGMGWVDGDFDYDGTVNLNDLIRLANQYGSQLGVAPVAMDFMADYQSLMQGSSLPVSVPEPAASAIVVAGAMGVLMRRRAR